MRLDFRTTKKLLSAMFIALLVALPSFASAASVCDPEVSRLISAQGRVDAYHAQASQWEPAQQGQPYCGDDKVRTGALSRAVLSMEKGIATFLALDQLTLLNFVKNSGRVILSIESGQAHIRSHTPNRFDVTTPFVNAGIEGTEFLVKADAHGAEISVFEGKVRVFNEHGEVVIVNGQTAIGKAGEAPILKQIDLIPDDAVRWALYYPPIIDFTTLSSLSNDPQIQLANSRYQSGDVLGAIDQLSVLINRQPSADLLAVQVGLLLTLGRVDGAEYLIQQAQALESNHPTLNALLAIIALTRNDKEHARQLTQTAIASNPQSSIPFVALSYVEQAGFNLDLALQAIEKALLLSPQSGLIYCRKAELLASQSEISLAKESAEKALSLSPHLGRTHIVLGFIQLMETNIDSASNSFRQAIELDASDPLAHFGLALANIRLNRMEEGKALLEIAASLNPNNSLLRSYLGKTYYELHRNDIAGLQYGMGKAADPKDPTPYFYNAILLQSENRPAEAIQEMETAIGLNNNRAVNRSKQMLDSDLAARGAALGRIYSEVGFTPRALVHAWNALADAPSDYTAHRLLADSYNAIPRSDFARTSEILQAQILQPVNITPIQPRLTENSQLFAGNLGPSALSLNEFNPLFERNRSLTLLSGLIGGNNTYSDEFVHSGIWNNLSYSLGQFHHQSDGYRYNNAIDTNLYTGFVQASLTPQLNVQAEYKHKEIETGYMQSDFFSPDSEIQIDNEHFGSRLVKDNYRLGINWLPATHSRILASAMHFDRDAPIWNSAYELNTDNGVENYPEEISEFQSQGSIAEIQYQFTSSRFKTIVGSGMAEIEHQQEVSSTQHLQKNGYIYGHLQIPDSFRWTLGFNINDLNKSTSDPHKSTADLHTRTLNPKLGLLWQIAPKTLLRAAAFKTTTSFEFADQTLEPTQIAGFNQFFDDNNQARSIRYGLGLDHNFGDTLKSGIEYSERSIVNPRKDKTLSTSDRKRESLFRGYLLWLPEQSWIMGIDYYRESYRDIDGDPEFQSQYIPVTINYYNPDGWYARFKATHYWQSVFESPLSGSNGTEFLDFILGYRFTHRKGLIELLFQNLLDKNYRYKDNSGRSASLENKSLNPLPFPPEFTVSARFTMAF